MPRTPSKTIKIIHVGLRSAEAGVVKKIQDTGNSVNEVVRELIRNYGKEHFPPDPPYVQVKKEELEIKKIKLSEKPLTNKEYAEQVLHAAVDGGYAYFAGPNYNLPFEVELSRVKKMVKGENEIVDTHLAILEDREVYPFGSKTPMPKEAMRKARENLAKIGKSREEVPAEEEKKEYDPYEGMPDVVKVEIPEGVEPAPDA